MKKYLFLPMLVTMTFIGTSVFSQSAIDTAALGLAGDNLSLTAVLDLFQKSKTIEEFEKNLNDSKKKINNLDLDLDKKIDFIKVVTTKKDESYTFVLQVPVSKEETQDVAVILLDRDKNKKVSLQIVGDEDLYGKNYVVEPAKTAAASTPNPGYTGKDPVTTTTVATTQTIVVESAPIVQYVYSPAYVPYYPPYYYGYYPPYFAFATVMAVGIYRNNHYYNNYGYHGGGGNNNIIINNNNSINHYNNSRNSSNTVKNNMNNGNYGNGNRGSGNRGTTGPSTMDNKGGFGNNGSSNRSNNPGVSNNASSNRGNSPGVSNNASSRDAARPNGNQSRPSASSQQASRQSASPSRNMGSSSSSMGRSMGGGGRSMGGGGGRRR